MIHPKKDLEYGIGAKEEKIIAAKDEEMNARIKKQEITSKIEAEIRMLNDEVSQTIYHIRALTAPIDWLFCLKPSLLNSATLGSTAPHPLLFSCKSGVLSS